MYRKITADIYYLGKAIVMNLKEKYSQPDLPPDHLDQLTSQLLTAKFDAEKAQHYRDVLAQKGIDRPVKTVSMKRRWPLLLGIAASFLLLIYFASLFLQEAPSTLQLADNYITTPFPHTQDSKGQTSISELRKTAILAYEQSDFQTSAESWEILLAQGESNPEDQFYLGLSNLYQNPPQLETAINQFQTIRSSDSKKFRGEAQWFLSIALIKANREKEAKEVLQTIVTTGAWNKKEAQKLLDAME